MSTGHLLIRILLSKYKPNFPCLEHPSVAQTGELFAFFPLETE